MSIERFVQTATPPIALALVMLAAAATGLVLLQRSLRRADLCPPDFSLARRLMPAMVSIALLLTTRSVAGALELRDEFPQLDVPLNLAIIWSLVYALSRAVWVVNQLLYHKFDITRHDNLRSRRVRTQLHFIEKFAYVVVAFLGLAATLMLFDSARRFGESLLASAGVAGIILGLAAQKSLGNLIAGFQIAFTQPLRIEDAVVVEGEWGWVEEINLTYVVIRIWDLRRLVLPITYFVEKPFQNWTRTTAQILGSVMLEVSHEIPFQELEAELHRLLDESPLWDRDKWVLQVVEANTYSVTLRALMTAKDSPTCWDLRCHIRRGLVEFLQQHHPQALPKLRLLQTEPSSHGSTEEVPGSHGGGRPWAADPTVNKA